MKRIYRCNALASIIGAWILGLPGQALAAESAPARYAAADTIWVLLGAALVFFMQPGFAMVETGLTRAKNAGNIVMKNVMDLCIGTIVFAVLTATMGLRVTAKEEIVGLDYEEHGLASAYADFMPTPETPGTTAAPAPVGQTAPPVAPIIRSADGHVLSRVSIVTSRERFDTLKTELEKLGITGMTVTQVLGYCLQKGHSMYRGEHVASRLLPKIKVDLVVSAIPPRDIVEAAKRALYTGHYGDGKIFVSNVDNVIKIRTGEEGFDALQDKEI